jgi:F5/8 type C domain
MNGIRLDKLLGHHHHQLCKRSRIIFVILMTSWVSTITLLGFPQPIYAQTNVPLLLPLPLPTLTATTCGQLQLSSSSVSASGFQSPNTPSNTLDNNLNTRWSNEGIPSFIQYNLGQSRPVCSVDIAWYSGASRTMTFTISFSSDGSTFTNPVQFQSRRTTGLENYDFPDINA